MLSIQHSNSHTLLSNTKESDIIITLNLNKFKPHFIENGSISINNLIKSYYNYIDCNIFNDLVCPCCKKKGYLKFHKYYSRNLVYKDNGNIKEDIINIAVLVCENCKANKAKQKYHALLPYFIAPYHIYEIELILKSIKDYLNKEKLKEVLDKYRLSHKQFYDWLKKFNKYLLSSSIVLKERLDMLIISNRINDDTINFLINFYNNYYHPYFLFKLTCVPLCINL